MKNYEVILGVSGGLGAAVARELVKQNRKVIGINRSGEAHPLLVPEKVEIHGMDVKDRDQLLPLLVNATRIYHCLNLPYSKWQSDLMDLTTYLVDIIEEVQVPLIISDNLYMYGEDIKEGRREDMPYDSNIEKGKVRAEVANYYQRAHDEGRIQMLMVRGPSYYGPGALYTSHYGDRIFTKILEGKRCMFVGDPEVEHTTIHVGDFARAMILLGDDPEAYGQAWHAPCPPAMKKSTFSSIAYQLAGYEPIAPRGVPGFIFSILGLIMKDMGEMKEMLYEFNQPYYVDHSKFMNRYPDFRITPLEEGIQEAIDWYRKYLGKIEVTAE